MAQHSQYSNHLVLHDGFVSISSLCFIPAGHAHGYQLQLYCCQLGRCRLNCGGQPSTPRLWWHWLEAECWWCFESISQWRKSICCNWTLSSQKRYESLSPPLLIWPACLPWKLARDLHARPRAGMCFESCLFYAWLTQRPLLVLCLLVLFAMKSSELSPLTVILAMQKKKKKKKKKIFNTHVVSRTIYCSNLHTA